MRFLLAALLATIAMNAQTPRILVEGHRGARAVLPENTLPGFLHAIAAGADYIELDTQVTRDDVVVVAHDARMNRTICQGPEGETVIRRLTLADFKRWDCGALQNPGFPRQKPVPGTQAPTLAEVLALAPRGDFRFNIEIKSDPQRPELQPEPAKYARLVVDVIKKARMERRVLVQSFDWRLVRAVKEIAPELDLAALYQGAPKDFVAIAREAGAKTIAPQFKLVTPEAVAEAHKAGLAVAAWTPNAPAEWDALIAARVDAIITDDPAALIAHLKAKGLR
jgi:glycerophosphoryl diester phosphodiesterase